LTNRLVLISRTNNSQHASSFFHIPAEQVIEIGVVVEIESAPDTCA